MIKSGNVQFNPEAFKDYNFEQFKAEFKGKLAEDAKQLFEKIQKANKTETYNLPKELGEKLGLKEHESNSKPSAKSKKP